MARPVRDVCGNPTAERRHSEETVPGRKMEANLKKKRSESLSRRQFVPMPFTALNP
jgi:hypothetical protein